MTAEDVKALVLSVDPRAQRYDSADRSGPDYTTWRDLGPLDLMAEGRHQGGLSFQVDRYTKTQDDPVAAALWEALDSDDRIAVYYRVDYERDTRYIHHIYDCEGV